jgi:peptide/nickel transport system permease protein
MLSDARRYLVQAPHLSMVPGLAAGLLAFAMQYTSDRLAARFTRSV